MRSGYAIEMVQTQNRWDFQIRLSNNRAIFFRAKQGGVIFRTFLLYLRFMAESQNWTKSSSVTSESESNYRLIMYQAFYLITYQLPVEIHR